MKTKLNVIAVLTGVLILGGVTNIEASIDRNATFTTTDGYTHDACGDVYDQWGNMVYDSPACLIDAGYDPFEGLIGTLNGSYTDESTTSGDTDFIQIGDYYAKIAYGSVEWEEESDQWYVDQENTALLMIRESRQILADHRSQGFGIIESEDTAVANINGVDYTLTKASQYSGTNPGDDHIKLDDGRYAYEVNDGWLIMYTCRAGSTGYDITVTYWN